MFSKILNIIILLASVEARFSQEQIPVNDIASLSNFGKPGESRGLAGGVPGTLLASANPCEKLTLADLVVTTLGTDPQVIAGARKLVAAEQNFNPFNFKIPSICSDASLPATPELRGVVPLVDPDVTGADLQNANSAKSLTTPFDATGLSVAGVMAAQGFSNFTSVDASGGKADGAASGNLNATAPAPAARTKRNRIDARSRQLVDGALKNALNNPVVPRQASNSSDTTPPPATGGDTTSSLAGADFGLCTPTIDLKLGRPGRKATEATFLPSDPLVANGQQDAFAVGIITNRICDQLTNVCEANQAAKDACQAAKATVAALGTKDQSTADAWNQALGF